MIEDVGQYGWDCYWFKFDDKKTMKVDMQTANAIVTVFDALKKPNQEKFITMLNKGKATFSQIVGFAWKAVK